MREFREHLVPQSKTLSHSGFAGSGNFLLEGASRQGKML